MIGADGKTYPAMDAKGFAELASDVGVARARELVDEIGAFPGTWVVVATLTKGEDR